MTEEIEIVGPLEYADMSHERRFSEPVRRKMLRWLGAKPAPRKGANLEELERWHEARLKFLNGEL